MHNPIRITSDMHWVGASDRRLALFENAIPTPGGMSYNAYLVLDEKTVLLDAVDRAVRGRLLENLAYLLAGRPLDYLIVNHVEPDHCADLDDLLLRYPNMRIVGNAKTVAMIAQFFDFNVSERAVVVAEDKSLCTGRHTFRFYMAPMVHWPEVMVTYDETDKVLYSADAFGTFGAINGNLFADEVDFEAEWLPEARRYYGNIVGKYGPQTLALLKKAAGLEIALLCPLHGPVWRENISWYVEKYKLWGAYVPEERAVMIAYASIYGGTENAADILAAKLAARGVRRIAMYDVSHTHSAIIVSEAFRCSHLVFASSTYNMGIFGAMETALLDLKAHNLQNRTVAIMENGSWAPAAGKLMREIVAGMKNITLLEETLSIRSTLKAAQLPAVDALAEALAASLPAV
ncbi:MAG: MBL fold metallo-hydrolase [Candidatus Pelethousia sp.]|nr:MBL fold metallo-hydrolase [Candidatus Pelethousia sp.]